MLQICDEIIAYTVCRFLSAFQDQLIVCKHYYFSFDNPVCFSCGLHLADFYNLHTRGSTLFDCNNLACRLLQSGTCLFQLSGFCFNNLQGVVQSLQANTNSAIALLWCVWMQPCPRNTWQAGASDPMQTGHRVSCFETCSLGIYCEISS